MVVWCHDLDIIYYRDTWNCEHDPLKIGNLMPQSFVEGFEVYFFPKLFDKLSASNK